MRHLLLGPVFALALIAPTPSRALATTSLYAYANGSSTATNCAETATPAKGCSLTKALADAAAGDTVYLATPGAGEGAGVYVGNWIVAAAGTSSSAPLVITAAPNLAAAPVLDGNGGEPVNPTTGLKCQTSTCDGAILTVKGVVDIVDVALANANDDGADALDAGGAIINQAGADLTVTGDTFLDNHADQGGGAIASNFGTGATLTVNGSTFADNSSEDGGAIVSDGGPVGDSVLDVSDSTFVANSAIGGGAIDSGGIGNAMTVSDSTFADNIAARGNGPVILSDTAQVYVAADIFDGSCSYLGAWDDLGDNVGTDASCENGGSDDVSGWAGNDLGPLTANGGPTETLWPEPGNPAIALVGADTKVTAGSVTLQLCPRFDQRGGMSAGTTCAAGAVEPLVLLTGPVPDVAVDGVAYQGKVTASSGFSSSYTYALTSGTLPPGLTLNPSSGALTGTPTHVGSYHLTFEATNSNGDSASHTTTLTVSPALGATIAPTPPSNHFSETEPKISKAGVLSVMLQAPDAGTFTVTASYKVTVDRVAKQHNKRVIKRSTITATYASARLKVTKAGARLLGLAITKAAARELAKLHTAKILLRTAFTPTGGTTAKKSVTVTVTRARNGDYG